MSSIEGQISQIIREKILASQETSVPKLTRRDARVPKIAGKAFAVIGMRRAGKTTYLHQQRADLLEQGRSPQRLVYFNFEDEPNLHPLFAGAPRPDWILKQLSALAGHAIRPEDDLLILDEIQACPDAVECLREFGEEVPEIHVAAAPSPKRVRAARSCGWMYFE